MTDDDARALHSRSGARTPRSRLAGGRARAAAVEQLADVEWPTTAEEIWRYSRIGELDLDRFRPVPAEQLGEPGDEPAPGGGPIAAEAGERSGLVVVRNGRVVHHSLDADLEAKGVQVCGIATCDADEIATLLGACSDASPDAFTVLHDAFLAGGAFVKVPAGVVVDEADRGAALVGGRRPRQLPAHAGRRRGERRGHGVRPLRLHRHRTRRTTGHLVDAVVELIVGDNAHVRYLSVQEHGPHTWQIALQRAHLGRDASLKSSVVALGGALRAPAQRVAARRDRARESDLTAVYFGDGDQMLDFRTLQDHDAPNTRSDLLFKGAVEDTAQSVYSGLIRIRPDAQKSVAFQTNRNLVLTEGAEAMSVPNLEIEADDVKCSHASTVGPVDDDQLYYLATRGVPPEEAERLIVLGFFDDVFDRLPVPSLVAPLRRSVIEKIEHRDPIARASA